MDAKQYRAICKRFIFWYKKLVPAHTQHTCKNIIPMVVIVLGAEYSFYVKSIATFAPQKVDIIIYS